IIVKALSGKPQDRYQTAEEMQVALEEWLIGEGRVVTVSDVAKCVQSRLSKQMRERNAALVSQSRIVPDQLLHGIEQDTDAETPTAGSVLVTVRPGQWHNGPRVTNPEDHTLDGVQVAAMKQAAHSRANVPASSRPPSSSSEATPIASHLSDSTQLVVVQLHALDSVPTPSKATASLGKPRLKRWLGLLLLLVAVGLLVAALARR
ncbi:MAG: hypothetical protein ABI488_21980, partial [Polyangiaceae bacterium]